MLPIELRLELEALLGADLSGVRLHVDDAPLGVSAIAFACGDDIHFAPGVLRLDDHHGLALLGHELAHVLQQRAGRVHNRSGADISVVHDPWLEEEADRTGQYLAGRLHASMRLWCRGVMRLDCSAGLPAARRWTGVVQLNGHRTRMKETVNVQLSDGQNITLQRGTTITIYGRASSGQDYNARTEDGKTFTIQGRFVESLGIYEPPRRVPIPRAGVLHVPRPGPPGNDAPPRGRPAPGRGRLLNEPPQRIRVGLPAHGNDARLPAPPVRVPPLVQPVGRVGGRPVEVRDGGVRPQPEHRRDLSHDQGSTSQGPSEGPAVALEADEEPEDTPAETGQPRPRPLLPPHAGDRHFAFKTISPDPFFDPVDGLVKGLRATTLETRNDFRLQRGTFWRLELTHGFPLRKLERYVAAGKIPPPVNGETFLRMGLSTSYGAIVGIADTMSLKRVLMRCEQPSEVRDQYAAERRLDVDEEKEEIPWSQNRADLARRLANRVTGFYVVREQFMSHRSDNSAIHIDNMDSYPEVRVQCELPLQVFSRFLAPAFLKDQIESIVGDKEFGGGKLIDRFEFLDIDRSSMYHVKHQSKSGHDCNELEYEKSDSKRPERIEEAYRAGLTHVRTAISEMCVFTERARFLYEKAYLLYLLGEARLARGCRAHRYELVSKARCSTSGPSTSLAVAILAPPGVNWKRAYIQLSGGGVQPSEQDVANNDDGPAVDKNIVELNDRTALFAVASLGYPVIVMPTAPEAVIAKSIGPLCQQLGIREIFLRSFCQSTRPALELQARVATSASKPVIIKHICVSPVIPLPTGLSAAETRKLVFVAWGCNSDRKNISPEYERLMNHPTRCFGEIRRKCRTDSTYIDEPDNNGVTSGGDYFTYNGPCVDDILHIFARDSRAERKTDFLLF